MDRLLLDFFEFLILYRLYLARIGFFSLGLTLTLSLSVGDLFVKLIVNRRIYEVAHVDLDKAVGSSIRQVVHASVVVTAHSQSLLHIVSVLFIRDRMFDL